MHKRDSFIWGFLLAKRNMRNMNIIKQSETEKINKLNSPEAI